MIRLLFALALISGGAWLLCWNPVTKDKSASAQEKPNPSAEEYTATSITIHLTGNALPLLGAAQAEDPDGIVLEVCEKLLYSQPDWVACCNEGDAGMFEVEAIAHWESLDNAARQTYVSRAVEAADVPDILAPSENIVVIIVVLVKGHHPYLETAIDSVDALEKALNTLRNIARRGGILSAAAHKLPAAAGHNLTDDQVLINFPGLVKI